MPASQRDKRKSPDARHADLWTLCRDPLRQDDAGTAGGLSLSDRDTRPLARTDKIWVHNPKLAKAAGRFGAYFRTGYSLSEREREIAVVIINSKWHSIYPTNAHERAAKAAGLPPDKVEALLSGLHTSFDDKREQVVYEMATCLANSRWVAKGPLRPCGRGARPCRHHRRDLPDGLLHECLDDARVLRRPGWRRGHGSLTSLRAGRKLDSTLEIYRNALKII